jgi:hypothetical protein
MHRKIMTADKLAARGLQHNSVCPPLPPGARGCSPSPDKLLFLQRGAAPIAVMVSNTRFAIVLPTGARPSGLAVFQCSKSGPIQSQNSYKGASIPPVERVEGTEQKSFRGRAT